jgi:hypothetical protein
MIFEPKKEVSRLDQREKELNQENTRIRKQLATANLIKNQFHSVLILC